MKKFLFILSCVILFCACNKDGGLSAGQQLMETISSNKVNISAIDVLKSSDMWHITKEYWYTEPGGNGEERFRFDLEKGITLDGDGLDNYKVNDKFNIYVRRWYPTKKYNAYYQAYGYEFNSKTGMFDLTPEFSSEVPNGHPEIRVLSYDLDRVLVEMYYPNGGNFKYMIRLLEPLKDIHPDLQEAIDYDSYVKYVEEEEQRQREEWGWI